MAVLTFLVRLARPPSFLNMHLADFPQYVLLFSVGILASSGRWIQKLNFAAGMRWLLAALTVGFAPWLAIMVGGGAFDGNRRAYSGWHWQSAAFDAWESFTGVAISFGLLVSFARNSRARGDSPNFYPTTPSASTSFIRRS